MHIKKRNPSKLKAQGYLDKAIDCLKMIKAKDCSEEANRKIDEALSLCYLTKDNIQE